MRNQKFILIAFLFIALSCDKKQNSYIFQNRESFNSLKLDEVIVFEKERGSKERLYDTAFGLGEDYYPNKLKYQLANPRIFERKDQDLYLESDYFYTPKDSLIKVVFYVWGPKHPNQDTLYAKSPHYKILLEKYNYLKNQLTHKLGKPFKPRLQPGCYLSLDSYCQWKTPTMSAYLAMHSSEVRLVVYGE